MNETILMSSAEQKKAGKLGMFAIMFAAIALTYAFDMLAIKIAILVVLLLIFSWAYNHILIVTDVKVCGQISFYRRVQVPLDDIKQARPCEFHGVAVVTENKTYKFYHLRNAKAFCDCINELI